MRGGAIHYGAKISSLFLLLTHQAIISTAAERRIGRRHDAWQSAVLVFDFRAAYRKRITLVFCCDAENRRHAGM